MQVSRCGVGIRIREDCVLIVILTRSEHVAATVDWLRQIGESSAVDMPIRVVSMGDDGDVTVGRTGFDARAVDDLLFEQNPTLALVMPPELRVGTGVLGKVNATIRDEGPMVLRQQALARIGADLEAGLAAVLAVVGGSVDEALLAQAPGLS